MNVQVTNEAQEKIDQILDYVFEEFGLSVYDRLKMQVDQTLDNLAANPRSFIQVHLKDGTLAYRAVVNHNTILVYEIDEGFNIVTVYDAFDARSNWK